LLLKLLFDQMIGFRLINHRNIYLFGIFLLAASLPLSIFTTSLAEIILLLNWISEGNFSLRFNAVRKNKAVLLILSLYFLHLVGLIYSSDFSYAMHDLRIKLPILILPLVFFTSEKIDNKTLRSILIIFVLSVVASSLISAAIFFGFTSFEFYDVHDISIFISHIRLSLMVNLAFFIILYYSFTNDKLIRIKGKSKIFLLLVAAWLAFFLFILKSLTGIVIFLLVSMVLAWIFSGKIKDVAPRFIIRVLLITVPLLVFSFITRSIARFYNVEEVNFTSLDKYTPEGNLYLNDTTKTAMENGHYVWLYFCEKELRSGWNNISQFKYGGLDKKGQRIKYTLIRYLTSKGLRKDASGINQLSQEDIRAIEKGTANYIFLDRFAIYPRIYEIIWELDVFKKGGDPSGHSVAQRIAYLKGARYIISKNFLFGVGTGDIQKEFNNYYDQTDSRLKKNSRRRAHNQFITFFVSFGLIGFLICMIALVGPVFIEKAYFNYLLIIFLIIGLSSMINEDTLETQTGVSFFMFFYSLFIFSLKKEPEATNNNL
jgi:O-Antigen ligase